MSGQSAIEWTDATWLDDRGRLRTYARLDPTRPGQQLRRRMAELGLRWCRDCSAWRADVGKNGLCAPHERAAYRRFYAANRDRVKAAKLARKRGIEPLPEIAVEYLLEQFSGRCAYCQLAPATTFDHVVPVVRGGRTEPGNVVPACVSCNSSKRDRDVVEWASERGFDLYALADVTTLAEVA